MPTIITEKDITTAYQKILETVITEGETIIDERGDETIEILNLITHITEPIPKTPVPVPIYKTVKPTGSIWHDDLLERYSKELTSKENNGFIYTYGNRLRAHFDVDQICNSIKRLKTCKESRRAISVTWDPPIDDYETDVPCLILVDFKIRDNKLQVTALWRSHDIYGAWFPNVVGLTYLAQEVAKKLNIQVGGVTVQSISAHINKYDYIEANNLIRSLKYD